jgi:hypothetical protein
MRNLISLFHDEFRNFVYVKDISEVFPMFTFYANFHHGQLSLAFAPKAALFFVKEQFQLAAISSDANYGARNGSFLRREALTLLCITFLFAKSQYLMVARKSIVRFEFLMLVARRSCPGSILQDLC